MAKLKTFIKTKLALGPIVNNDMGTHKHNTELYFLYTLASPSQSAFQGELNFPHKKYNLHANDEEISSARVGEISDTIFIVFVAIIIIMLETFTMPTIPIYTI